MTDPVYNVVIWAHYVVPIEATNREEAIRKAKVVWSEWSKPETAIEAAIDHVETSGIVKGDSNG